MRLLRRLLKAAEMLLVTLTKLIATIGLKRVQTVRAVSETEITDRSVSVL